MASPMVAQEPNLNLATNVHHRSQLKGDDLVRNSI